MDFGNVGEELEAGCKAGCACFLILFIFLIVSLVASFKGWPFVLQAWPFALGAFCCLIAVSLWRRWFGG